MFVEDAVEPPVRGFLHSPATPNSNALILTHGAGFNAQSPLLSALADVFCAAGFTVLRCDLPFRQTRRFGPPGPGDSKRDRAGLKNAVAALNKIVSAPSVSRSFRQGWEKIFLGGHSYGGRQASMLAAEEPDLVAGLLLLSYPLHPPGKQEQIRTQHFPNLRTPTLFVHGTLDPFASIEELEQARKLIPAQTQLLTVERAGHDLGFKGKTRRAELPAVILQSFQAFFFKR